MTQILIDELTEYSLEFLCFKNSVNIQIGENHNENHELDLKK